MGDIRGHSHLQRRMATYFWDQTIGGTLVRRVAFYRKTRISCKFSVVYIFLTGCGVFSDQRGAKSFTYFCYPWPTRHRFSHKLLCLMEDQFGPLAPFSEYRIIWGLKRPHNLLSVRQVNINIIRSTCFMKVIVKLWYTGFGSKKIWDFPAFTISFTE